MYIITFDLQKEPNAPKPYDKAYEILKGLGFDRIYNNAPLPETTVWGSPKLPIVPVGINALRDRIRADFEARKIILTHLCVAEADSISVWPDKL